MAKPMKKRVRVIKTSPVFGPEGNEIGNVVINQLLTVSPYTQTGILPVVDPSPWGAYGVQAHIPAEAVEIYNGEETLEPRSLDQAIGKVEMAKEDRIEDTFEVITDAIPNQPKEQEPSSAES